jgi:DNA-binding transcriptional LysR family regulator
MRRESLDDFKTFVAVAEAGSFTKAAAELGISQSAVSYSVRMLEQRLGVRLISRTTRSLSLTDAGERLLRTLAPAIDQINSEIEALTSSQGRPTGRIRVTISRQAARTVIWPILPNFFALYPEIEVELSLDEGLMDIVAGRFDAGIRLGERLEKDMIGVRVSPDLRMALVGSPAYFATRPVPKTPRDLSDHLGVNYRQRTGGGLYAWEFEREGEKVEVRMNGPLTLNDGEMLEMAALEGLALAFMIEDQNVLKHIAEGRLVRVLEDWCQPFPGYHLYYPSRRQPTTAFSLFVDALRRQAVA